MRILCCIILACFINASGNAQVLNGIIIDAESGKALFPVTVVNLSTQKSTYSDDRGKYSIEAMRGDKIMFTFIGYGDVQRITPTLDGIAQMQVQMVRKVYDLNELVIRPRHYTKYQLDSLDRHSTYHLTLQRTHSSAIMSPFSFIAEKISPKSRALFRFQKNFSIWEKESYVDTRYTPDLVNLLTGLEGDTLGYFMNANPMPYDFARYASDLELNMWIRSNYKFWLKTPQIPKIDSALLSQKR